MIKAQTLQVLGFPLQGTRLIEASAGTGKTWTLAALYVRLILSHGGSNGFPRSLLPPEILVVTFTEAATRELRDRIRQRLSQAARCFQAIEPPSDDFLAALLADYPEQEHPQCALLLTAAAQWMDEAAIFTIHSFCQRVLTQYAFLTGSHFQVELQQDLTDLQQQAARDYWRNQLYPLPPSLAALAAQHWQSPEALLQRVRPLFANLPSTTAPDSLGQILAAVQAAIEQQQRDLQHTQAWVTDLQATFEAAWEDGVLPKSKPSRAASIRGWLDKLAAWAEQGFEGPIPYTDATLAAFQASAIAQAANDAAHPAIQQLLNHPAWATWASCYQNKGSLSPHTLAAMDTQAAHWIHHHLNQLKQQQRTQGFDDLLLKVQAALQGAQGRTLASRLTEQFPFALVDEFQDTDPVQFSIFSQLYQQAPQANSTGFCMIGDPKQAIYGFRGADIHTYLAARTSPIDGLYQLDANFRSSPPLVAATNRLFQRGNDWPAGPFLLGEQIPFVPVRSRGEDWQLMLEGSLQQAQQFWLYGDGDSAVTTGNYLETLAQRTASFICRLLNSAETGRSWLQHSSGERQPVKPADIALLVRDGHEADILRQALLQRQIPSVYLSQKASVFNTTEANDMLAWLRALAEPHRESLVRAALASHSLHLDYATLDTAFNTESQWELHLARFADYQQISARRGILPALHRLMHDYQVPGRLQQQQDERALTNLLHLAEILQQASQEQDGPQALIHWFEKTLHQTLSGQNNQDRYQMRLESDDALIRVITIHKSKGLEYPLVFLPFVCRGKPVTRQRLPVRYSGPDGRPVTDFFPDEAALAKADQERLAEDIRLLYVALTRARYHCWIGMAPVVSGNGKQNQLHRTAIGYLLAGGADIANDGLPALLQPLASADTAISPVPAHTDELFTPAQQHRGEKNARRITTGFARDWRITSFSALQYQPQDEPHHDPAHHHHDDLPPVGYRQDAANGLYAFPRGAQAGSLLHSALEWLALQGFPTSQARWHEWPLFAALPPEQQQLLPVWMQQLLTTPMLPDSPQSLSALARHQYLPEMEFWMSADQVPLQRLDALIQHHICPGMPRPALVREQLNGLLKGFIDLTLEVDGRYWVLDYKSNHLGNQPQDYHPDALAARLLEARYDVQCALYLLALHRLLGQRMTDYQPAQHLGGGLLWFIRGIEHPDHGVYAFPHVTELVLAMDLLFQGPGETP